MRLSASSLGCRARALSASRRGGSTLAWRITPLNTKSWSAVCIRRRRARISFPVIASRPLCDTIRIARSQHPTELPLKHTDFHRQVSWYSKGRALHTNIYFAARVQAAREMDVLIPRDVLTHRSMDVSPGSKGGYAIGNSSQNYFDTLRNRSVAFQCGMQFAKNQIGNVSWPRRTSAATSAWLMPGVGVTDTDPFSQLSATPRTLMAFTKYSMQLDAQVSPAIELLTRNSLVNEQAAALDLAVLNGTGGAQPLGILNAGIGTASGASSDFAKIVKMQTDVADANGAVNFASLSYVAPPLTAGLLKGKQRFPARIHRFGAAAFQREPSKA